MRESSSARDRDRSPRNDRKNWDYKDKIRDKEVGVVCGCLWSCSLQKIGSAHPQLHIAQVKFKPELIKINTKRFHIIQC